MTTLERLLDRKQRLIERLLDNPSPHEREEIERVLDKIDTALASQMGLQGPCTLAARSTTHEVVLPASYRFAPAERAKAFLTAADSFAQLQDNDPPSQTFACSIGGRLTGRGIFGVRANGAPISR